MSTKEYLKAAKKALLSDNFEYCAQLAENVLEIDPNNYFAYLFHGKASHLMGNIESSRTDYKNAIALDPKNQQAWKGLFLVVTNDANYNEFFNVVTDYAELLIDLQEPLVDIIKSIRQYTKKYPNDEVYEEYLRRLLPENKLGQITGGTVESYESVLEKYLNLQLKRENDEVSKKISRERMKTKVSDKLDSIAWKSYRSSQVPHLYQELINIVNDDEKRRSLEEKYLQYRIKVLKVSPPDVKKVEFLSTKEMIEGMIFVNHTSFFAWYLYFDWIDVEDLSSLDENVLKTFLKLFEAEPLGQVIHALLLSGLSTYKIELSEDMKTKSKIGLSAEEKELQKLEQADEDFSLSPEELLELMKQGLQNCKTSLFAHRVVLAYHIYLKRFQEALVICEDSIRLLVNVTRDTGDPFSRSKEDILVNYAVILTYHEAPKNFNRAMELYDKILVDSPNNVKAKIGKGLILAERGDLVKAEELLGDVVAKNPENDEAVMQLSWVQIRLGSYQTGRDGLLKVFKNVTGNGPFFQELRAAINWKIAQSYLLSFVPDVEKAYEYLVESLRQSRNYAPSYTSLGEVYHKYYEDPKRAKRCFLRAFEIDSSDALAARYLIDDFTSINDWNRAEAFTKALISSDAANRILGNDSWPYRVLGVASLEQQDVAKAVEWFQNAIRINPQDIESWVGLGEAYAGCGRLDAAVKVFKHALELDPNHWVVKYLLGTVLTQIGDFDDSVEILKDLFDQRPNEECIISALYEALLKFANGSLLSGFFGRAVALSLRAVDFLKLGNKESLNFWKAVSSLIEIFLQVQSKIDEFPREHLLEILKGSKLEIDDELVEELISKNKLVELAAQLFVYANQAALVLDPKSRALRSSTFYNLGLSQVIAFLKTKNKSYRESAIFNLKESIKLQNNYPEAWIVLGVASISVNPRVAQHCLIKASSLDQKNSEIWSNLALLYLRYGDWSLANESYMRGQSVAPSESIPWLGQALTFQAQGDLETAFNLFTHAFVLSNGKSPSAQLAHGVSVCLKRIGKGDDLKDVDAVQEFAAASFGMLQYLKHYPLDPFGLSVTCLILERLNDYELGKEVSEKLLKLLEENYEESEDEKVLQSFVRVKSQNARFELGLQNFEQAINASLECLELAQDDKAIISSRTVLGLSYFFLDRFDDSLEEFKEISILSNDARRLIVLIAQVLYVYDSEETKQAALDQLFHNIENSGSSLLVTLVIGAICIIENMQEYLVIIKEELENLPLLELIEDKFKNVPYLLSEIDKRLNQDSKQPLQRSAFYFPTDINIWKSLDKNIGLKIAAQGKITASDLSSAYFQKGNLSDIQRSLFLAPWNTNSVKALKGCF